MIEEVGVVAGYLAVVPDPTVVLTEPNASSRKASSQYLAYTFPISPQAVLDGRCKAEKQRVDERTRTADPLISCPPSHHRREPWLCSSPPPPRRAPDRRSGSRLAGRALPVHPWRRALSTRRVCGAG